MLMPSVLKKEYTNRILFWIVDEKGKTLQHQNKIDSQRAFLAQATKYYYAFQFLTS